MSTRDQRVIVVESECQKMNEKQSDADMIVSFLTEGLD